MADCVLQAAHAPNIGFKPCSICHIHSYLAEKDTTSMLRRHVVVCHCLAILVTFQQSSSVRQLDELSRKMRMWFRGSGKYGSSSFWYKVRLDRAVIVLPASCYLPHFNHQ